MIFDIDTLHKINELFIKITDNSNFQNNIGKERTSFYYSNYVDEFKTDYNFPQVSWWNNGKYILVGIGENPQSKIYPEFRVYDSDSKKIIGNFKRKYNPSTESLLVNVFNNPEDSATVLFLMKSEYTYTIFEADVFHNESKEIWFISSYDFCFIKLSEDLSWIFVGSRRTHKKNYK